MHHTAKYLHFMLAAGAAIAIGPAALGHDESGEGKEHRSSWRPQRLLVEEFPWDDERLKPKGPQRPGITTIYLHGFEKIYDVYTVAYRFDPDIQQPPHTHPDRRSCFVLAGVWYFGYGSTWDPSVMRELVPGSHYSEPANVPHFAGSGPQGAVVECTAHGPSGTTFVNPADAD
jgi:hypothetical protein